MAFGGTLDALNRRVQLKLLRRKARVSVSAGGRTASLQVRPGSTDQEVVWQCFKDQQYRIPTIANVRPHHRSFVNDRYAAIKASGKIPLIVDCGANIGASAIWFDLTYPGSKIVTIEPAPDNIAMLHENTKGRDNIEVLGSGIGPDDKTAYLLDQGGGPWGYRVSDAVNDTQISVVSIQSVLARYPGEQYEPFILKIDIEGAEASLFQSHQALYDAFPLIILEPHDFSMPGEGTSTAFFKFHAEHERDFLFRFENIFSFRMKPS